MQLREWLLSVLHMETVRYEECMNRAGNPGDQCPVDFGPWGAWRSISGWITAPFVTVDPEGDLPWVRYGVLSEMPAPPELFAAVGWSP